ncbi:hypothetical protein DVH24_012156 [Malus domestica]|uniref:Uncharacterized protein n=1 Tax=Malus domestica TaxID=3750 RepID=A0A498HRA5_MALDO|nr:hypothetical protein DVH24_012156 [Malus domestica]
MSVCFVRREATIYIHIIGFPIKIPLGNKYLFLCSIRTDLNAIQIPSLSRISIPLINKTFLSN